MQAHKSTLLHLHAGSRAHLIKNRKQARGETIISTPRSRHTQASSVAWPFSVASPRRGPAPASRWCPLVPRTPQTSFVSPPINQLAATYAKTLLEGVHSLDRSDVQRPWSLQLCVQHASSGLVHVLATGSTGILRVDWSTLSIYGNVPHWMRAQRLKVGVAQVVNECTL